MVADRLPNLVSNQRLNEFSPLFCPSQTLRESIENGRSLHRKFALWTTRPQLERAVSVFGGLQREWRAHKQRMDATEFEPLQAPPQRAGHREVLKQRCRQRTVDNQNLDSPSSSRA